MMGDSTTTKLNADSHLFLDQPLLRLPLELQRRNFKQSQIRIDHEQKKQTELLRAAAKNAGSASIDDTVKAIDDMLKRMESMKDDLQKLHAEEQDIHQRSAKRIDHVQELYEIPSLLDVKYETWSHVRLNRLVVDYLLRAGYSDTAAALANAKDIEHLIDVETFKSCHKIADSIEQGSTVEALRWLSRNKDALKKLLDKQIAEEKNQTPAHVPKISLLEFELRFQEYIMLLASGSQFDAIPHARKYLWQHMVSFPQQSEIIAGLLAYDPSNPTEPYSKYFSPSRWKYLSELFVATHNEMLLLPARPLLHLALSAGLSALKTPACHSALNPASADNPKEHAKFTPSPSHSTAIGSSLCPICSTELNALARNVPYAHHTKSSVENDPLMLPNGRVYGRERLQEAEKKQLRAAHSSTFGKGTDAEAKNKTVVDPVTGDRFSWDELRKVYIT